jgi:hypothetical protein
MPMARGSFKWDGRKRKTRKKRANHNEAAKDDLFIGRRREKIAISADQLGKRREYLLAAVCKTLLEKSTGSESAIRHPLRHLERQDSTKLMFKTLANNRRIILLVCQSKWDL